MRVRVRVRVRVVAVVSHHVEALDGGGGCERRELPEPLLKEPEGRFGGLAPLPEGRCGG